MIITQYYNFEAPELTDAPDVSYLGTNWQDLDGILHNKADLGEDGKVPASQLPSMNFVTPTGNGSNITVNFTEAATDVDIATGETLATIAGKLLKNINVLQTATGNNATAITNIVNGTTKVGSASNADTVGGFTVGKSVPANALFTDTVYTHPSSHPYSMLTGAPTSLPANGGNADTVDGVHLSGLAETNYKATVNLNTIIKSGMYRCDNATNSPPGLAYGQLIVARGGGDTITQIYGNYTDGRLYTRSGNPSDVGGVGAWSQWRGLASSVNTTGKDIWVGAEASRGSDANTLYFCY